MKKRMGRTLGFLLSLALSASIVAPASAATDSYGWSAGYKCLYGLSGSRYAGPKYSLVNVQFAYHYDSRLKDYVYVPYAYKVTEASSGGDHQTFYAAEARSYTDNYWTGDHYYWSGTTTYGKGPTRLYFKEYFTRSSSNYILVTLYSYEGTAPMGYSYDCVVQIAPH